MPAPTRVASPISCPSWKAEYLQHASDANRCGRVYGNPNPVTPYGMPPIRLTSSMGAWAYSYPPLRNPVGIAFPNAATYRLKFLECPSDNQTVPLSYGPIDAIWVTNSTFWIDYLSDPNGNNYTSQPNANTSLLGDHYVGWPAAPWVPINRLIGEYSRQHSVQGHRHPGWHIANHPLRRNLGGYFNPRTATRFRLGLDGFRKLSHRLGTPVAGQLV